MEIMKCMFLKVISLEYAKMYFIYLECLTSEISRTIH